MLDAGDQMIGTLRREELGLPVGNLQLVDGLCLKEAPPAQSHARVAAGAVEQAEAGADLIVVLGTQRLLIPAQARFGGEIIQQVKAQVGVRGILFAVWVGADHAGPGRFLRRAGRQKQHIEFGLVPVVILAVGRAELASNLQHQPLGGSP